jgi:hypothetical protein
MSTRRSLTALVAALSMGVAQGCAVRQYPRPDVLPDGTDIAVVSTDAPVAVHFSVEEGRFPRPVCHASRIGGYSTGRQGDTIRFAWVAAVTPYMPGDTACAIGPTARAVLPPTAQVVPHNNLSRLQVATIVGVGVVTLVYFSVWGRSSVQND